jgi:acyl-CoA synthetase (NDP forming)
MSQDFISLQALFQPRGIAVYGASATPGKLGHSVVVNLRNGGFPGAIIPINPNCQSIEGLPTYATLVEMRRQCSDTPVDCAFLAIPAASVTAALSDCELAGVRTVIVGASGFAELGNTAGLERQNQISQWSRRTGIRVLGPNTNGILSVPDCLSLGYNASHSQLIPTGSVSVISHSGALFDAVARRLVDAGCGLARFVPVGNEADISMNDVLEWLIHDAHTHVVGLVIEGLDDGERFLGLCLQARARGKFLVGLKVGRSSRGAQATMAHSRRMAGEARTYDALFDASGVASVTTIEALAGTCALLAQVASRPASMRKIASQDDRWIAVTTSGAGGAILADMTTVRGMALAGQADGHWPEEVQACLNKLPTSAQILNPIDAGSLGDWTLLEPTFAILESAGYQGPTVVFAHMAANDRMAVALLTAIVARRNRCAAPIAVLAPGGLGAEMERRYLESGITVFRDTAACCDSLAAAFGQLADGRERADEVAIVEAAPPQAVESEAPLLLSEIDSSRLLAAAGIPMVLSRTVQDTASAQEAAAALGYPVVLKALAPGVAHKHDLGLVVIGITSGSELESHMANMQSQLRQHQLDEADTTWIVQPMLKAPVELILGMTNEPALGRFLMVGLGGLLAEILDAVEVFHIDQSEGRIRKRLSTSLTARAIEKYCGDSSAAAIDQVVGVLSNLRRFVRECPSAIDSIDINPLLVGSGVFMAVDALVVMTGNTDSTVRLN